MQISDRLSALRPAPVEAKSFARGAVDALGWRADASVGFARRAIATFLGWLSDSEVFVGIVGAVFCVDGTGGFRLGTGAAGSRKGRSLDSVGAGILVLAMDVRRTDCPAGRCTTSKLVQAARDSDAMPAKRLIWRALLTDLIQRKRASSLPRTLLPRSSCHNPRKNGTGPGTARIVKQSTRKVLDWIVSAAGWYAMPGPFCSISGGVR